MQQTEKYQLNLIEMSDTFSPASLNENAQKLEAALDTKADAAENTAAHDALDQRVTVLELHKFAAGYYVGNGKTTGDSQFIDLGFTPKVVLVGAVDHPSVTPIICSEVKSNSVLEIVSGGFLARRSANSYSDLSTNSSTYNYAYLALG